MSAPRVRLGSESIVHGTTPGGWTTCGVMYGSTAHDSVHFMSATQTDDPVDCMVCLVQETRGPLDSLTIRATVMLPVPVQVITFVIETEPKK